jgi:tRNA (adenine57-N1/adenine58-N1)-methyltransferase
MQPAPPLAPRSDDFALTGVADVVTVFVRDTEATGFPASLAGAADAVFLDLPGPHRVAASAVASLRPDGMLCSFSPCIEQVQRMCIALAEQGMADIRTIEVLDREYEFQHKALLLPPAPVAPGASAAGGAAPWEPGRKRAREEGAAEAGEGAAGEAVPGQAGEAPAAMEADGAPAAASAGGAGGERRRGGEPRAQPPPLPRAEPRLLTWPVADTRGHTGYLTFARKPTEVRGAEDDAAGAAADDDEAEEDDDDDAAGDAA